MWAFAILVTASTLCRVTSVTFWPPQLVNVHSSPYWANNSHDGVLIDCSDRSKLCLSRNQLLHEPSNTCHDLGARQPCTKTGGTLVIDADSFRTGRLRTYCRPLDECQKTGGYTMAYDGKCFTLDDIVKRNLCPNSPKMVPHPFGGMECHRPIFQGHVKSSYESDRKSCTMPSLRNERFWPWVGCNEHESECLRSSMLPYLSGCHPPLVTDPCPKGQWLVLDESAAKGGTLSVNCANQHPCGPDKRLFREDKSCHSEQELSELCKEGHLILTPSGDTSCSANNTIINIIGEEKKPGLCEVNFLATYGFSSASVSSSSLDCGANNQGKCGPQVLPLNPSMNFEQET